MRELYKEWQYSGQSKKTFAIGKNIKPSTFCYWSKKFEQESRSSNGFVPIQIASTPEPPIALTIHYPSGIKIEWHGVGAIDELKALL